MTELNRGLAPGANMLWDHQVYEVLRRTDGPGVPSYVIRAVDTDWHLTVSHDEIADAVYSRRCVLGVTRETPEADAVPDPRNCFDDLPEDVKQTARERLTYVQAALSEGIRRDEQRLEAIAQEVATENNFAKPMKGSTLRKSIARYLAANRDISALVPANHRKGRRTGRYPADVYKIWSKVFEEVRKEKPYATANHLYAVFARTIKNENTSRQQQGLPPLPIPQKSFVRRRISTEDRYKMACKKFGKRRADQLFAVLGGYHQYDRVLQYTEGDVAYLPTYVRSDTDPNDIFAPRLAAVIDAYSRMNLGHRLCRRQNKREIVTCLRQSIQPKNDLVYQDGETAPAYNWPAYGVPDFLRVDNGPEFNNNHVKDALSVVGVTYDFAPPKTPEDKPFIERFFRTIKENLLPNLPGYITDDNFREGSVINGKLLTFSDLEKVIHRWICQYYHNKWHEGVQATPLEKWSSSAAISPPRIVDSYQQIIPFMAFKTPQRIIDPRGVKIQNKFYFNEELVRLRQDPRAPSTISVHYDQRRPEEVWAHDPVNQRYLKCVPRKAHGGRQQLGSVPALDTADHSDGNGAAPQADEDELLGIIEFADACATKPRKKKKVANKKTGTADKTAGSDPATTNMEKKRDNIIQSLSEHSDDDEPLVLPGHEMRRSESKHDE